MDFTLTDEQQMIQQTARQIGQEEFSDSAFRWEDEFPAENQRILAEQGLLGIGLPMKYGGGGYSIVEVLLAQETVGRICPDTAHILSRSSMGAPRVIAALGNDHLKEKYLEDVCAGEQIITIAISESKAGSDVGNMQTSVEYNGDNLLINGSKMWVTKAKQAGAFLIYTRFPDDNIGAIVVDKDAEGLSLNDGSVNMAGHIQSELYFDDCTVPREQILVHNKDAFKQLLAEFNVERCHNAMMCVACGLNAFDKALEHANPACNSASLSPISRASNGSSRIWQ